MVLGNLRSVTLRRPPVEVFADLELRTPSILRG